MRQKIKRWWFKQKIKHDLRVEYSGLDKTRMKKDLDSWMEKYDKKPFIHIPTYSDNTIWYYYGSNLLYILLFGILILRIFV
jgi:hypothetical protein